MCVSVCVCWLVHAREESRAEGRLDKCSSGCQAPRLGTHLPPLHVLQQDDAALHSVQGRPGPRAERGCWQQSWLALTHVACQKEPRTLTAASTPQLPQDIHGDSTPAPGTLQGGPVTRQLVEAGHGDGL